MCNLQKVCTIDEQESEPEDMHDEQFFVGTIGVQKDIHIVNGEWNHTLNG